MAKSKLESGPAVAIERVEPCVILSQLDLVELSGYLGRNIDSKAELLYACSRVATVNVQGEEVTLEPMLLTRLKSRCPTSVDFAPWLGKLIKDWAHAYVGW